MAINKQDLHDSLFRALQDYSSSEEYQNDMEHPNHMNVMAETMQKYFEENTEITYGWAAVLPPPASTPDPVVLFKSTVKFAKWNLSMPMTLIGLAAKIMASTATGVITHAEGFAVSPGTYLIKPLVLPQNSDPEQCLMKCIVEPVCDWMLTLINPLPLPGTHGTFTGSTVSMVIS